MAQEPQRATLQAEPQRALLAELLGIERECCAELARIVDAERRAVARRDLPALLDALKERESLQARWQRASAERRARFASPGSLSTAVAGDRELEGLLRTVRSAADALERAQRINVELVRGALAQVGDLLGTLRRAQPSVSYDGSATLTTQAPAALGSGLRA